jgi:hypothetical protein
MARPFHRGGNRSAACLADRARHLRHPAHHPWPGPARPGPARPAPARPGAVSMWALETRTAHDGAQRRTRRERRDAGAQRRRPRRGRPRRPVPVGGPARAGRGARPPRAPAPQDRCEGRVEADRVDAPARRAPPAARIHRPLRGTRGGARLSGDDGQAGHPRASPRARARPAPDLLGHRAPGGALAFGRVAAPSASPSTSGGDVDDPSPPRLRRGWAVVGEQFRRSSDIDECPPMRLFHALRCPPPKP